LSLGQVVPFDEAGGDRLADGGLRPSGGHDGGVAEHDTGPYCDHPALWGSGTLAAINPVAAGYRGEGAAPTG